MSSHDSQQPAASNSRRRNPRVECLMGAALLVSDTPKPRSADTERAITQVKRLVDAARAAGLSDERVDGMLLALNAIEYGDAVARGES